MKIRNLFNDNTVELTSDNDCACIYRIIYEDENNIYIYIGATMGVARRATRHFSDMKAGKHTIEELNTAYAEGKRIDIEIVEVVDMYFRKEEQLKFYEKHWIECYDERIFNITKKPFVVLNKNKKSFYSAKAHTNQKGENNANNKYTKEQIIQVKKMIADGVRNKDIEEVTNIDAKYIPNIRRSKKWNSIKLCEEK